ncbi:hypothetical protein EMIHUDRAFT_216739 [Emiliania huxleyi CCMP1516]|uniref:Uncharacterized protein n=2 Tax=Emiliania huxleyi TaxID=2903 RepID=A0A0D3IDJ5_EMIH1|nr:hypothetical protein EMIHUDRAFT_216739 [Emiliania huxleyi CCMP1516]EOD09330.1 hypothetical protein EMIHUDRAFT_216739 [Emiliania huxleyi CCMP1516]|eukprot:XP_005761759.1 hypothetical protein EMIHUDRAFT_216739 [Emiliania huxleyi CCMP1516]
MVTAAELPSFNATSGSFSDMKGNQTSRMGHFRPVYRQKMNANDEFIESGEYLYYMTDLSKDNWVIGPEPGGILRGIQSSGSSGAHCPNMAMGWVGATGGKENGGWSPPGGVSVAPKYCGFEGPKLVRTPDTNYLHMAANFRLTDLPSHPRCGLSEDCPRGVAADEAAPQAREARPRRNAR